jgi:asparagine synthase (glutamine-hydrolysing)
MCGIAGYIDFKKTTSEHTLSAMIKTLHHRGPDDIGTEIYKSDAADVAFGHTRLSIIDLTHGGHQPMHYENYSILLNGEVYNYKEIRSELELLGHKFISESDTEVVLQAYARWGRNCVSKFLGMFAFVIYDRGANEIIFCRDRAGVKPLYYYWNNGLLLFASELKAFHQHPGFAKTISFDAVYYYLQYSYVPGPLSIFENCYKVQPGQWLIVNLTTKQFREENYWDLRDYYNKPLLTISYDEAKQKLEELIISSCNYRMIADVPVGVFLSGGYDSAGVAAILQSSRTEKLKTFTIGFPDGVNEAPFAKEIANYIGTNHTEFDCSINEAKSVIEELPYYYDEPYADISSIPTIMVSRLARQSVTVALSGDGGDELFAGYGGFPFYFKLRQFEFKPWIFNRSASYVLSFLSELSATVSPFHQHKIKSFSQALRSPAAERVLTLINYKRVLPLSVNKNLFKKKKSFPQSNDIAGESISSINDPFGVLLLVDYITSLRDQLLVKTDRATMCASLEGREPLLDHRLAEFAAQLPMNFKISGNNRKIIFKDIVHQYVDPKLLDRPKVGFDLPIFHWLKNDLSHLIDDYLNEESIRQTGFFDEKYVTFIVSQFRKGKIHYNNIVWRLIQFQMWYRQWMK